MIKINDNITINYIPMTNQKVTAVGVYIYRPLTQEDATKNALLPYVLQRGFRMCPTTEEVGKAFENLYGATLNISAMKQGSINVIGFNAKTISDRYAPEGEKLTDSVTELLLSCIFEPVTENGGFSAEYVRQEKKSTLDSILGLLNDKRTYAQLRCIENMCEGDSYAVSKYGTVEGVNAIDEKNLYEYYKSIITSSVIDIFVCGDTDISSVAGRVREFTDKFTFTAAQIPPNSLFERRTEGVREVSESMDVTQGKLCIGLTTGISCRDDDYWAIMVANCILGGGAHSKLFNNVREKLSLAYYASSQLEKNKGLMFINAGVEFDNYEKALNEIKIQISDLQNGNISDEEFSAAVLTIVNSLDSYYDDQNYMQIFRVSQRAAGVDYDLEYMKQKVKEVSIEDAARAAKKISMDTVYFLRGVKE